MGSFPGRSQLKWCRRIGLIAATLAVQLSSYVRGQSSMPSQFPVPTGPTGPSGQSMGRPSLGPEPDIAPDPIQRHTQIEAAKRRNVERQNKLQADSDKISRLAKELSSSVEPVAKTADPPAMAKKVEEIEKLARSVKELMKSD